jgi:hypothetical protein
MARLGSRTLARLSALAIVVATQSLKERGRDLACERACEKA